MGTESVTTQPSLLIDGARQEFSQITILPGGSQDLVASWYPRAVGMYTAVASVPYGSTELRVSSEIIVGLLNVKILAINFGEFRLGDPFRVSVDALNEWGAPLPVQASFTLEQNATVSAASSTGQTIAPLAEGRFTGFLETTVDNSLGWGSAIAVSDTGTGTGAGVLPTEPPPQPATRPNDSRAATIGQRASMRTGLDMRRTPGLPLQRKLCAKRRHAAFCHDYD